MSKESRREGRRGRRGKVQVVDGDDGRVSGTSRYDVIYKQSLLRLNS